MEAAPAQVGTGTVRKLDDPPPDPSKRRKVAEGIFKLSDDLLIWAIFPLLTVKEQIVLLSLSSTLLTISKRPRAWANKKVFLSPIASYAVKKNVLDKGYHAFINLCIECQFEFYSIPMSIINVSGTLTTLSIIDCKDLFDVEVLQHLHKLVTLVIKGCSGIKNIDWGRLAETLQILDVSRSTRLPLQDPNNPLPQSLTKLNLSSCFQVHRLDFLGNLPHLRTLILTNCYDVTDLEPLKFFHSLQTLNLDGCYSIVDISPLGDVHTLSDLSLRNLSKLLDVSPLAKLKIQNLNLRGCRQLENLQPLEGIKTLQNLDVSNCKNVKDIAALQPNGSLHTLDLSHTSVAEVSLPLNLQEIQLGFCGRLTRFLLVYHSKLHTLNLSGCGNLSEVSIEGMPNLHSLDLSHTSVARVFLGYLPSLMVINLSWCTELSDVLFLVQLPVLKKLDLSRTKLLDVSPLTKVSTLTELNLSRCDRLSKLGDGFSNLRHLNLSYCTRLDKSKVEEICTLESLDITDSFDGLSPVNILFKELSLVCSLPKCNVRR